MGVSGVYRGVIWLYGWYFINEDIGRQGDDRLMMLMIDIMERGRISVRGGSIYIKFRVLR